MSQRWKITFSFDVGPVPKGQVVYVTTESVTKRPTEKEVRDALRSIGMETEKPWHGIGSNYLVDHG